MYIYPLSHKEVEKKVVLPSLFAQEGKKERERKKNCDGAFDSRSVAEEEGEKRLHGT